MALATWLLAVRIGVLGIFAPTHVELATAGARHELRVAGERLIADGKIVDKLRVDGQPLVEVAVFGERGARIRRHFHGAIEARAREGAIQLVNVLDDEDYLPGTVALESVGDHPEALRAQAVLARTVVKRGARHAAEGFDLCDLTHCQTYRGSESETDAARAAVADTRGEVVTVQGRTAEVYFTSSCGGATADVADVWGHAVSHLRSVACDACRHAGATWEARVPLADVDRAVGANGHLSQLTIVEKGAGGVVRRVRLEGDGRILRGEELRILLGRERAIGWSRVKSPRFEVTREGGTLVFRGSGDGHLVGVCEVGAAALARAGVDHRAILRRYLPGADVTRDP